MPAGRISMPRRYVGTPTTPQRPEANGIPAGYGSMRPSPSPGSLQQPCAALLVCNLPVARTAHLLRQAMHCLAGLGRHGLTKRFGSTCSSCMPPLHHLHAPPAGVVRRLSDNGALSPAGSIDASVHGMPDGISDADRKQRELYTRQQQLLREQRTADQEKLLATISGACVLPPQPCLLPLAAQSGEAAGPPSQGGVVRLSTPSYCASLCTDSHTGRRCWPTT